MGHLGPLWQQAGSYSATADRQLLAALWPAGGANGGAVTAVLNTMSVSVAAGSAAVPMQTGQGAALCHWDAAETVTLTAAPPSGQSRVDLIVCQVRDNALDGGANNDFVITAVPGTPAASGPAVPATPNNAYVLATVLVPGAAANLNGATITNLVTQALAVPAPPAAGAGLLYQAGSLVQATGGAGNLDGIPFPQPFPHSIISRVVGCVSGGTDIATAFTVEIPLVAGELTQHQGFKRSIGTMARRSSAEPCVLTGSP